MPIVSLGALLSFCLPYNYMGAAFRSFTLAPTIIYPVFPSNSIGKSLHPVFEMILSSRRNMGGRNMPTYLLSGLHCSSPPSLSRLALSFFLSSGCSNLKRHVTYRWKEGWAQRTQFLSPLGNYTIATLLQLEGDKASLLFAGIVPLLPWEQLAGVPI